MWSEPEYRFELRHINRRGVLTEVNHLINVTKSAPPNKPGKQLRAVFEILIEDVDRDNGIILDLGAGKLEKSLYFLNLGYKVYSAEYEDIFSSAQAKKNRKKAETHPNFVQLIFPDDFYSFEGQVDLILLINVQTVMPIPLERIALLMMSNNKLKRDGKLLWYSDPLIRNKKNNTKTGENKYIRNFSDGYLSGRRKKLVETFYVELIERDIEAILELSGFNIDDHLSSKCSAVSGNNIVFVARPTNEILLNHEIDLQDLMSRGTYTSDKIYNTSKFPSISEIIEREIRSTRNTRRRSKLYDILSKFD